MMDVLPNVPVILLAIVAVWFCWPMIVDPIAERGGGDRRALGDDLDDVADGLFAEWSETERS